jgi:hypothetical protein
LYFVEDQQGAYFGATRAERLHEGGRRPPHNGIALPPGSLDAVLMSMVY